MNIDVRMSVLARGICGGTNVENTNIFFPFNAEESLMGYKRQVHADRLAALNELSAYDQEIGI